MTWELLPQIARPEHEMRIIADLVLELTRMQQNRCPWLMIKNYAPELLGKLLRELYPPPPAIYKKDV